MKGAPMFNKKTQPLHLGKDSIYKIFIMYAIPSILAMLAQTTAALVDSIFIGQYVGPEGIAAITFFSPFLNFIGGAGIMIAIGGGTMAGIHYGKGELKKSNNYFNLTCLIASLLILIATPVFIFFSDQFATFLGITGITAEYVVQYASTLSYFFFGFIMTFIFTIFLKLDGKPVLATVITLTGTISNILLDYLFIGVFKWGIRGAALATGFSMTLPFIAFLTVIILKSSWKFKWPHLDFKEITGMLFNGSSEFFSMASLAISGLIYNTLITYYIGVEAVAGYGIALQASNLVIMLFYGMTDALQAPISFNFGAKTYDRVTQFLHLAYKVGAFIGISSCLIFFFFGNGLASLFVRDTVAIEQAAYVMKFFAFSFILTGANISTTAYYTSVNQPLISCILAVIKSLIGVVVGLIIFPLIMGDIGLWIPLIFTEVLTFGFVIYYRIKLPFGKGVLVTE